MTTTLALLLTTLLSLVHPYAQEHQIRLTKQDTVCLAEAIYYEARGEKTKGVSVAYVILNRAKEREMTPCAVVHAPHQFSYLTDHQRSRPDETAWRLSLYLAVYAQLGLVPNPIGNATSYNERPVSIWLKDYVYERRFGTLYFYRSRGLPPKPELLPTPSLDAPPVLKTTTCGQRPLVQEISFVTVPMPDTVPFPAMSSLTCDQVTDLADLFRPMHLSESAMPRRAHHTPIRHRRRK